MSAIFERLSFVAQGGPVLMILAALSVAMVTLVLVKLYQFHSCGLFRPNRIQDALADWTANGGTTVPDWLPAVRHPAAQVLEAGMRELSGSSGRTEPQLREELTRMALAHLAALSRHLRGLEVIAQIAPLLGLLGTILGMIKAFQVLEHVGSRADPALLAGGIWEALLTTAAGLAIAIPAATIHHWLESMVDGLAGQIEDSTTRLFTMPPPPARRMPIPPDGRELTPAAGQMPIPAAGREGSHAA
jgi:biopolymer transport protein ExbB